MSWIKMREDLDGDPAVMGMADRLKIDVFSVIGGLWKVWTWVDRHSTEGKNMRIKSAQIDAWVGCKGFAAAMRKEGWLAGRDNALSIPNFDRHNGETAKQRALANKRMAKYRYAGAVTKASSKASPNRNHSVTGALPLSDDASVTKSPPDKIREDKRREEKEKSALNSSGEIVQHAQAQNALRYIAKVRFSEIIGTWGQIPLYDQILNEALEQAIPQPQFEAMVWWYTLPDDEEIFDRKHPAWDRRVTSFISLLRNLRRECQKAFGVQKKMSDALGDIDPIQ